MAHVTVELLDADVVIATGAAVTYRADLEGAGLGTGRYGFSIVVPPLLKDGKDHNIKLRVRNSTYTLQNSLQNLNCPYGGRLEEVDCANFKGWAWNPNKPNIEGLIVELLENNIVLGSTNAKIYREDLAANGIGTGYYGFLLPIPQSLKNGYAHTVSMHIKGTNFFLDESPKTFTCFSPSYEGALETTSCNELKGWAWDKNNPTAAALTVELLDGNVVVGSVVANAYRQDLKDSGKGTGNYGFTLAMPNVLKDGQQHTITLRVKGSSYKLAGTPRGVNCVMPALYGGALESATCTEIKGWAWNQNYPSKTVSVELIEGSTVLATSVASIFRQDLDTLGTGNYGFVIASPSILRDGQSHSVSVRIQGTNILLSGSPKIINCAIPPSYEGALETTSCNELKGWAWDKNNPTAAALTVELLDGNVVVGSVVANAYRQDLKDSGKGTGNYGFTLAMPNVLKDGQQHTITLRVKGSSYKLAGTPRGVNCVMPALYGGALESATCTEIKGWAWNQNYPSKTVSVELIEGSTVLATSVANIFRQDLDTLGTGNYGFVIASPSILRDGQSHSVSVRIQGTNILLSGSPKIINCAIPPSYEGALETTSCNELKGWAWDKNNPTAAALTVELLDGNVVVGSVVANAYRQDLKDSGKGTGNYGFTLAMPNVLKDGQQHTITLRVKGSSYKLAGTPRGVNCVMPALYGGALESATCTEIKGWAWNQNYPSKTVSVELIEGSTVLATSVANIFRQDLDTLGTGNYGFVIASPSILRDGQSHSVSVRIQGTNILLSGSPKIINCAIPPSYEGALETTSCNELKGWAWDKNNPTAAALTVELLDGNVVVGSVVANAYRQDLKDSGKGTGNYGFTLAMPNVLKDGQQHTITLRVKGSSYKLAGTPRGVNCVMPALYGGALESASCTEIKGWAWNQNYPSKTVSVELIEGSTVLATSVASIFRQDLDTLGTGNYGFVIASPSILRNGQSHSVSIRIKGTSILLGGSPIVVNCPSSARMSSIATAEPQIDLEKSLSLTISPNPNTGSFKCILNLSNHTKAKLVIRNIAGTEVWKQQVVGLGGEQYQEINLNIESAGIYIVTLEIGGQIISKRMVVLK
ncbi:T9SS type A sorting domain-containing protein [Dyadobacter sp. CY347]|uniref:T9SS type A sorting domain-containing protein n=1 Tax=Dyadobacter sp. CY347 TaxID=2909336 RepID=UPI001F29C612|nr:T9SS type A sorting domain-containing protein [Dyadobacter sp. CY347]MCF2487352.1 T9SS type A sorting domain-containing protein [Dyadobacter sp. CY347]